MVQSVAQPSDMDGQETVNMAQKNVYGMPANPLQHSQDMIQRPQVYYTALSLFQDSLRLGSFHPQIILAGC